MKGGPENGKVGATEETDGPDEDSGRKEKGTGKAGENFVNQTEQPKIKTVVQKM